MKYLEYPELELLSRALTFESAECKVFTRMEAYSCKTVSKEKRLLKNLESTYLSSASTSPPDYLEEALASPFGRLDQASARKTLFLLIATLNVAFPDHDFSEVNPADFRKESSPAMVLNSLSTTLLSLKTSSNAPRSYSSFPGSFEEPGFALGSTGGSPGSGLNTGSLPPLITHPALSHILDDIMNVSDCEVYTFHPDMDSDPHASAEPEEEGDLGDDDPYDDEEYWDDDSPGMRGREDTPRARTMHADDDEEMVDAPMFDEDVYGEGPEAQKRRRKPSPLLALTAMWCSRAVASTPRGAHPWNRRVLRLTRRTTIRASTTRRTTWTARAPVCSGRRLHSSTTAR